MASPTQSSAPKMRFGAFELNQSSGTIRKGGIPVKLQPQPFRVLLLLVGSAGRVVSRDEIQRCLWGDSTFVDFERGINFSINQIRSALCDSAEKPRYVETLPRVGYRFIASVTVDSPSEPIEIPRHQLGQVYDWKRDQQATVQASPPQKKAHSETETFPQKLQPWNFAVSRRNLFVLIGSGLLVLAGFVVLRSRYKTVPEVGHDIRSLAVLPLENLSGDASQDYFADGMTDQLITNLGQIHSLRVISRTSAMQYRGVHKSLPQVARELRVDAIIEGTVLLSGGKVRITAQLIQGREDRHLWAQSFEGDLQDVLVLQEKVSRAIASQVQMALLPGEHIRAGINRPLNMEAYESYLKGEYYLNRFSGESIKQALEYFQQAVEKDPGYAPAYAKMSGCYRMLANMNMLPKSEANEKARALVAKALELDPNFGAAHAGKGWGLLLYDLNFASAGDEFERAVELSPNSAEAHEGLGDYYAAVGRLEEAVHEVERARELDPLASIVNHDLCQTLTFARRWDEALAQCKANLELNPNSARTLWVIGDIYTAKGMEAEARSNLLRSLKTVGASPKMIAAAEAGASRGGLKGCWQALIPFALEAVEKGEMDAFSLAVVYTRAGNADKAISWLHGALKARSFGISFLRVDPAFDSLRSDPRFLSLLKITSPSPN